MDLTCIQGISNKSDLVRSGLFRNKPSQILMLESTVYTQPCVYVQLWTMRYFLWHLAIYMMLWHHLDWQRNCIITILCFFRFYLIVSFFWDLFWRINVAPVKHAVILFCCQFDPSGCKFSIKFDLDIFPFIGDFRVQKVLFELFLYHCNLVFERYLLYFLENVWIQQTVHC